MPKPNWPTAAPYVPTSRDPANLSRAADACRGCPLHADATQAGLVSDLRVAAGALG